VNLDDDDNLIKNHLINIKSEFHEKSNILFQKKDKTLVNFNENISNRIEYSKNYLNYFTPKEEITQDSIQKSKKNEAFNISNVNIINTEDIEKDEERLEKINGEHINERDNKEITYSNKGNQEDIKNLNIIQYRSLEFENIRTQVDDYKNLDNINLTNEKIFNITNSHTNTQNKMHLKNNIEDIYYNSSKKQSINIYNINNSNINLNTKNQFNMKNILPKSKNTNSKKSNLNVILNKNKKFSNYKNSKLINNQQILDNISKHGITNIKYLNISEQIQNNNKNINFENMPQLDINSDFDRILERNSKSLDKTQIPDLLLKKNFVFNNNKYVNNLVTSKHNLNKKVNDRKFGKSNYHINKHDFKSNIEKRIKDNKSSCEIISNNLKLFANNNSNNNLFHVDTNSNFIKSNKEKFRSCNKVPCVKKFIKSNDNFQNILITQVQNNIDGDEKKNFEKSRSRTFLNVGKSTSLDKIRTKIGNIENSQNFLKNAYNHLFNTSINHDLKSKSRTNKFLNIQTKKYLLNKNNYNKTNHSFINNLNIYSKYDRKYDLYTNNIFINKNSELSKNKEFSNVKPRYMEKATKRNKTVDVLAISAHKIISKKAEVELDCLSNKTNGINNKDTIRENLRKKSIQSISTSLNYCYTDNTKINEKMRNLNFLKEIDNKRNINSHSPQNEEDEQKNNQYTLNTKSLSFLNYNTLPNYLCSINGVCNSNTEENDYEVKKKIVSDKFSDQNKLLENFDNILKGFDIEKTKFENETNKTMIFNNKYNNLSKNYEDNFNAERNLESLNLLNQSNKTENIDFNNFLKNQFFEIPYKDYMNSNNHKDKINGKSIGIIKESKIFHDSNQNNKNQNDLLLQLNTTNNLNSNNIVKNKYKNLIDNYFN